MSIQPTLNNRSTYPSEYFFPTTVEEALQILAQWNGAAKLIAGGTDLMLELGKQQTHPQCFVSTERIQGLDHITIEEESIRIGAAVTLSDIKDHPFINQHIHVLADAARSVGSLAIQNVATLVGNIVNAMPAADGAIAAIALEAEVLVIDSQGSAWRPVETLFLGPGSSTVDPTRQLVTQIRFPNYPRHRGTAWYRLGRRPSLTLPILNCAVSILLDERGEKIEHAVIALGPVSPIPFRAHQAEHFLLGRDVNKEALTQAALLAQQEATPRGNVLRASKEYRLAAIPAIVESALLCAIKRARE